MILIRKRQLATLDENRSYLAWPRKPQCQADQPEWQPRMAAVQAWIGDRQHGPAKGQC